jgi:hypothetical protein
MPQTQLWPFSDGGSCIVFRRFGRFCTALFGLIFGDFSHFRTPLLAHHFLEGWQVMAAIH